MSIEMVMVMEYLTQVIGVLNTPNPRCFIRLPSIVVVVYDGEQVRNVQLMSRLVITAFEDEPITLQNRFQYMDSLRHILFKRLPDMYLDFFQGGLISLEK